MTRCPGASVPTEPHLLRFVWKWLVGPGQLSGNGLLVAKVILDASVVWPFRTVWCAGLPWAPEGVGFWMSQPLLLGACGLVQVAGVGWTVP